MSSDYEKKKAQFVKDTSRRIAENWSKHYGEGKPQYIEKMSLLAAKNLDKGIEKNKDQYNKDVRLTKAELVELCERVATNRRIKLRAKTKSDFAFFLAFYDGDQTYRDPKKTPGPSDPDCKCPVCELLRKRNAAPFSIYDDVEDDPMFPFSPTGFSQKKMECEGKGASRSV